LSNLRQVGEWTYLNLDMLMSLPPLSVCNGYEATTECLYVDAPFKVDRVTIPPATLIRHHRHPHVSSYEIYVYGRGMTWLRDRYLPIVGGEPGYMKAIVPRGWWHGGYCDIESQFLTVQEWTGDVGEILDDWDD
jgi:hypothetical protein